MTKSAIFAFPITDDDEFGYGYNFLLFLSLFHVRAN